MYRALLIAFLLNASVAPALTLASDVPPKLKLVQSFDKGVDSSAATIYGLALSPDGKHALLGGDESSTIMVMWNFQTGENDQYFDLFIPEVDGSPYAPALSPDGKSAAVATTLGKFFLIDLASGNVLAKLDLPILAPMVRFSPDSKQIALINLIGELMIIDQQDPTADPFRIRRHNNSGLAITWSTDGRQIITTSGDKTARVWDVATKKELQHLTHDEWVWSVASSPDSKVIATGTGGPLEGHPLHQRYASGKNHVIRLWDAATGKVLKELTGSTERIHTLAFTPDGKRLVSGGFDKTLRLWDVTTGRELTKAESESWIFCIAVAADSRTIVVAGGSHKTDDKWQHIPKERARVFRIED